jgi:hypothetical protein
MTLYEIGLVLAIAAVLVLVWLRGRHKIDSRRGAPSTRPMTSTMGHSKQELDLVAAWPPEATRALTAAERAARESLIRGLPECMILAQIPLARFIKVSRRNSYADWLTRVGHMSADLLICDRTSLVLAVVAIQSTRESPRAVERRAVMHQVLKAAGVRMIVWREHAIPEPDDARAMVERRLDVAEAARRAEAHQVEDELAPVAPRGKLAIPVPEVVALEGEALEPQSSTWFSELDTRYARDFEDTAASQPPDLTAPDSTPFDVERGTLTRKRTPS